MTREDFDGVSDRLTNATMAPSNGKSKFSKGMVIFLVLAIIVFAFVFAFKKNMLVPQSFGGQLLGESLTIGKIEGREIEVCHGDKMKRTFPDFDYALYGYNIIKGYPMAIGHDPGLTRPIFVADYSASKQTADCRYQVPRGYALAPDVACVTSFTSDIVVDISQFSNVLSLSASIEGGGWGAKFSASTDYKSKSTQMSQSESVFIFSKAVCNYYFSKFDSDEPPALSKTFVKHVKDMTTEQDVFQFFDYYGTHFQTYTLFGARFIYENKMSKKSYQEEKSSGGSVSVKASYSGLFTLGGGFGMSKSNQEKAENFQSKVETKTISIGAPPPANGNTMTWASTVKETPIPVKYTLASIDNLFTKQFMEGTGIDYKKMRALVIKAKPNYCQYLLNKGSLDGCTTLQGTLESNSLMLSGKSLSYSTGDNRNECLQRCQVLDCIGFTYFSHKDEFFPSKIVHKCYPIIVQPAVLQPAKIIVATSLHPIAIAFLSASNVKTTLYFDRLKLLDKSLKLNYTRVQNVQPLASFNVTTEDDCIKECLDDQVCSVLTYNEMNNDCFLYNFYDIPCNIDENVTTKKQCHTLAYDDEQSVTWFNPIQTALQD